MATLILFAIFFILAFFNALDIGINDPNKLASLASALTSVAATMLGFMLAALSILATISGIDLVKSMTKGAHYKSLLNKLFIGSLIILLLLICSLWLLFGLGINKWFNYFYISLLGSVFVALIEIGHKFWLVLSHLGEDDDDENTSN